MIAVLRCCIVKQPYQSYIGDRSGLVTLDSPPVEKFNPTAFEDSLIGLYTVGADGDEIGLKITVSQLIV